jgi:iron complex transport system ATP-binding protein
LSTGAVSPLLEVMGLDVSVAGLAVCRALDLCVEPGQCWALLGRNGVGKTSLLHTLAGLRRADRGDIRLLGEDIAGLGTVERAKRRGLLAQDDETAFPATVLECALTGRFPHLGRWGWERAEDQAFTREALGQLGLAGFEDRNIQTLSGGERRRVALAALLAQDPVIALLDEPTNHLDPGAQIAVLKLLRHRFTSEGRSILMVLHDVNLALRFSNRLLLLFGEGRWRAGPTASLADARHLGELYGHAMELVQGPRGPLAFPL